LVAFENIEDALFGDPYESRVDSYVDLLDERPELVAELLRAYAEGIADDRE
jgi:hypothetical protein